MSVPEKEGCSTLESAGAVLAAGVKSDRKAPAYFRFGRPATCKADAFGGFFLI